MAIERDGVNGEIAFCCDKCSATHETETDIFDLAIASLRRAGWRIYRIGQDWVHECPDHVADMF